MIYIKYNDIKSWLIFLKENSKNAIGFVFAHESNLADSNNKRVNKF